MAKCCLQADEDKRHHWLKPDYHLYFWRMGEQSGSFHQWLLQNRTFNFILLIGFGNSVMISFIPDSITFPVELLATTEDFFSVQMIFCVKSFGWERSHSQNCRCRRCCLWVVVHERLCWSGSIRLMFLIVSQYYPYSSLTGWIMLCHLPKRNWDIFIVKVRYL